MTKNAGSILAALLCGVVIGGAAALLLTPMTGADLRAKVEKLVRENASKLNKEEVEALVNKILARVKDYFTDAQIEEIVKEEIQDEQEA